MQANLKNIINDFTALLFPEYCYACEKSLAKGETIICTECRLKLPYIALSLPEESQDNILMHRFYGKIPIKHALSFLYFRRAGRVQHLLHALKYQGVQQIGHLLGSWYGHKLKNNGYAEQFDLIIPVPLHPKKLRKRGYNQAETFAQGIAGSLEVPCITNILTRTVNTASQTNKSRPERWENVGHVFAVKETADVMDKKVLVIDDVLTTGATLEACALALLKAGCKEVSVGAIAAA